MSDNKLVIVPQTEIFLSEFPVVVAGRHSQAFTMSPNLGFMYVCCTENLFIPTLQVLFSTVWA